MKFVQRRSKKRKEKKFYNPLEIRIEIRIEINIEIIDKTEMISIRLNPPFAAIFLGLNLRNINNLFN